MYTTCPACQTVFRLTAATLRAAIQRLPRAHEQSSAALPR
jgi:hypothetical protein